MAPSMLCCVIYLSTPRSFPISSFKAGSVSIVSINTKPISLGCPNSLVCSCLFVCHPLFVRIQAQLDDTAVRLAAQEAALRGAQQRQQLASLRAQLNALQHAPISSPATLPAKQASNSPPHDAGVAAVLLLR